MTSFPKTARLPPEHFAEVGVCIYCGAAAGLEDEHVVAFGLGGNAVLPAASCRACASVTSRFELDVLRGPMRPIRIALGIQSRRKHAGAPTRLPLRVKRGGQWETISLSYQDYPLVLEFFVFGLPGYIDPSYTGGIRVRGHQTFSFGVRPDVLRARLGADAISAPRRYAPTSFARMTAKIGYAMAVARGAIDPSQGRPEVVDSILGRVDEVGRSVGTLAEPRILRMDTLHDVTIHVDERTRILFARVQYLASVGSPVYGVFLGSIDAPFVRDSALSELRRHPSDCRWATHAAPIGAIA